MKTNSKPQKSLAWTESKVWKEKQSSLLMLWELGELGWGYTLTLSMVQQEGPRIRSS